MKIEEQDIVYELGEQHLPSHDPSYDTVNDDGSPWWQGQFLPYTGFWGWILNPYFCLFWLTYYIFKSGFQMIALLLLICIIPIIIIKIFGL